MKTTSTITLILLTLILTILSSCRKDDETQPKNKAPGPNYPANPNNPTIINGTDYVEFKLDGNQIILNNFSYTPPAFSVGIASILSEPVIPLYQFIGQFHSLPGSEMSYVLMNLSDTVPLILGRHDFQGYSVYRRFSLSLITKDGNFLLPDGNCISNIEFSRLDTIDEGKVEGTFSLSNLNLQDADENIISRNHSINDGKFSLTLKK